MAMIKSYEEIGREPMVGDRVLIVEERKGFRWNYEGYMDRYLSTIMTVRKITRGGKNFSLGMFEDQDDKHAPGGWAWFPEMIAGVIIDEIEEDPSVWTNDFDIDDLLTS